MLYKYGKIKALQFNTSLLHTDSSQVSHKAQYSLSLSPSINPHMGSLTNAMLMTLIFFFPLSETTADCG